MTVCVRVRRMFAVTVVVVVLACCATSVQAEILIGTLDYTFEDNSGTATLLYDNFANTATILKLQLTSPGYLPDTSDMAFGVSLTDRSWQDIAPPQPFATIAELDVYLSGDDRFLAGSTPYSGSRWGIWLALTADPDYVTGLTVDNGLAWIKEGSWSNMVAVPEPASSTLLATGLIVLLLAAWRVSFRHESPESNSGVPGSS